MKDKIIVVWLCHFSNSFVHEKLDLGSNFFIKIVKRLAGKATTPLIPEFANWITNGIAEMEKMSEVELHVVCPYPNLKNKTQEFSENSINYHFFRSEDAELRIILYKKLFRPSNYNYCRNRSRIHKILDAIQPDIIHLFGAENPYYASALLDNCGKSIIIAQLQTLMNDPIFRDNYPIDSDSYEYRSEIERKLINKADYIATPVEKYRQIIKHVIKPNAQFLNISLALKDPIVMEESDKQFDFVYFAACIDKAADLAIEAFSIAYKERPFIKLDIIGGYDIEFKHYLDYLIRKYGIVDSVTFEGSLPTHNDVLKQIRKSRFALLPLKVDITSSTIREAMSNGLPVATTDTGPLGTQQLNLNRENVLISPIGNHRALANNMVRLLDDNYLAETLRQNAFLTRSEANSNEMTIKRYVETYKACLENYWNKIPFPIEITEIKVHGISK